MIDCIEAAKRGDLSSWTHNYSLGNNIDCFCHKCPELKGILSAYVVADAVITIYLGIELVYEGVVS